MTTTATYVRITNGNAPEFITWPEARDEVNAAQIGETKEQVSTMSSNDNGQTHHITYTDGRRVTIRPATDADQPAPAPVERNVTPLAGGKVHLDTPSLPDAFPLCRTGSQANAGTQYRYTDESVSCASCSEQLRRRALRLENEKRAAHAPARSVMSDEQFWQ